MACYLALSVAAALSTLRSCVALLDSFGKRVALALGHCFRERPNDEASPLHVLTRVNTPFAAAASERSVFIVWIQMRDRAT